MNETEFVCDRMSLCLAVEVKEREVSKMSPWFLARVTARIVILLTETGKKGKGILSEGMMNLILDTGSRSQSQKKWKRHLGFH